ncbi:MAG: hypothetical protein EPO09_01175 [Aquabacterium sp.]|uniref:hypothetical protein n=1 Tax=Aquabacterium sp. TaxID=1872578 RepID=UPI001203BDA3|nr:hypothetical protein [Aquabacterium sp.]TAK99405.1 MAG: hypothetical protein EPO09_01175 [Aquabacterium sp.]
MLAAALLCIPGCSSNKSPPVDLAKVHHFEAQGYPAPHEFDTSESEDVRLINGLPERLVWCRPLESGVHPLLIYMPGQGQNAHAFEPGRHALAQAGYVVMSWQPLPEDEMPSGQSNQNGWQGQRYAAPLLQKRSELLRQLHADLLKSQGKGDQQLQGVNLSQIGLIGFDLGAYTVAHAAGEAVSGTEAVLAPSPFKAYIVISPYASFEQGAFDTRYKGMSAPLLTLTSDSDVDPNGGIPAAYLRTAPFGNMPAGNKYMLVMRGARHATLGEQSEAEDGHTPFEDGHDKNQGKSGERRGQDGRGGKGRSKGSRSGDVASGDKTAGDSGRSPTTTAMQRTALTTVSIAFLDAYLLDDTLAHQWLQSQAGKWLSPIGDWRSK